MVKYSSIHAAFQVLLYIAAVLLIRTKSLAVDLPGVMVFYAIFALAFTFLFYNRLPDKRTVTFLLSLPMFAVAVGAILAAGISADLFPAGKGGNFGNAHGGIQAKCLLLLEYHFAVSAVSYILMASARAITAAVRRRTEAKRG